jgi:hypothetical protein
MLLEKVEISEDKAGFIDATKVVLLKLERLSLRKI